MQSLARVIIIQVSIIKSVSFSCTVFDAVGLVTGRASGLEKIVHLLWKALEGPGVIVGKNIPVK